MTNADICSMVEDAWLLIPFILGFLAFRGPMGGVFESLFVRALWSTSASSRKESTPSDDDCHDTLRAELSVLRQEMKRERLAAQEVVLA